jgi:glycosyltransferase involved in cell wall biosynthesis
VQRIQAACPGAEILVVDGGGDATGEIVGAMARDRPGVRYVRNHGDRGKGHAVSVGIAASRGDVLAQIDADLQFLPEELPRLLAPILAERADLALGSRFLPASARGPGSVPGARGAGNRAISAFASAASGHRFSDLLAGMKAWRTEVTRAFRWQSDGFSYEAELPIKAVRLGFRVVDVPVTTEERRAGRSSVNVVRTGLGLACDIVRFSLLPT